MGNILSVVWSGRAISTARVETMERPNESENVDLSSVGDNESRVKAKEQEMEEFKKQLNAKREQRKEILARHRNEKKELEASVDDERKAKLEAYETNRQLRELLVKNNIEIPETLLSCKEDSDISDTISNMKGEFEKLRDSNIKLRRSLSETTGALQIAYSDMADLQAEHTESIKHIGALKEVVKMSKTLINLREGQLTELKNKLTEIEQSLADRETSMLSTDLRNEYVKQLQNMRTLRSLYEERARLAEVTKRSLIRELEDQKAMKEAASNKCKELETKVEELEAKVNELLETMDNKNSQISASQAETHGLKNEMSVVNKLFSQVLLGYKSKQDLDKLVHRLEENHGLLTHMAEKEKNSGSEASTALPKLLLELVSQVDEGEEVRGNVEAVESTEQSVDQIFAESTKTTAEDIVENLPKVWRVLIELLSHQSTPEETPSEKVTTCYKSVETKSGPVLVPSVSQTYIRLKDLIVEKLALVKEVNRMKQLNVHLESRLGEQERRLCLVTTELSKTWHVVGRLRRHHHQLHTHEKILKYELQQKRKLLNELKEELEYCREKWEQAREKNVQSERDWKKLRAEFTSRKKIDTTFNHSAESGYSDERQSDESSESNDESEYVTNPLVRSKKKLKKSFENILDSSADCNLVAEREDPASDLLDVAELPLDNQDGDNSHDISDSYNSESIFKSEIICEETEDEIADIAHDYCVEDVGECSQEGSAESSAHALKEITGPSNDNTVQMSIDPAEILKSIKQQNERLAKKDEKLDTLEKGSANLLKQMQTTVKISEQISNALDNVINRPSSSNQRSETPNAITDSQVENDNTNNSMIPIKLDPAVILKSVEQKVKLTEKDKRLEILEKDSNRLLNQTLATVKVTKESTDTLDILADRPTSSKIDKDIRSTNQLEKQEITAQEVSSEMENETSEKLIQSLISNDHTTEVVGRATTDSIVNEDNGCIPENCIPSADFKAILENVKKQTEMLSKKDERLQKLESDCTEVVDGLAKTLSTANEISEKLEAIHEDHRTNLKENTPRNTIEGDSSITSDVTAIVRQELLQLSANDSDEIENHPKMDDLVKEKTQETTAIRDSDTKLEVSLRNKTLEISNDQITFQSEITLQSENDAKDPKMETAKSGVNNSDETTIFRDFNDAGYVVALINETPGTSNEAEVSHEQDDFDRDSRESSEPSTSSERDHEARFAARDIRLKKLEEQTKSLVKKVNKTTSKGVKINYKLEELHNIYGSENSRAGTPSEDDKSQNDGDDE